MIDECTSCRYFDDCKVLTGFPGYDGLLPAFCPECSKEDDFLCL